MNEDKRPLMVTVQCFTYNHERYIRECLEGFVMQKTNFRFEAIVHDDASTDGTADIVREYAEKYPNIIKPIFEIENQYSKHDGSLGRIMDEHTHGKYVAVCEGDDYWIDPYKLQKQFDLLEGDPTISFCHHNFYELRGDKITIKKREVPKCQDILSVAAYNPTQTLTMFFRNIQPLIPEELAERTVYSQFWALRLAEYGDIVYIDEPMAVYRRNSNSIFGTKHSYIKFSMALYNIDNMIIWEFRNQRMDVCGVLMNRARKMCIGHFLYHLKRCEIKHAYNCLRKLFIYKDCRTVLYKNSFSI